MSDIEHQATLADRDWWMAFGNQFNWQLYGWTYRDRATFYHPGEIAAIIVTGKVRDSIQAALNARGS